MDIVLSIFLFLCIAFPIIHMIHAMPFFRRSRDDSDVSLKGPEKRHGISILVPCYNEQEFVETSIVSMKNLPYTNYEVIYINDGSEDQTFSLLQQHLNLQRVSKYAHETLEHESIKNCYQSVDYPNFYVIDKENGGKADSLNAGIEHAEKELIVTLDADTLLTEQALPVVNRKFQDGNVVAAGGMVHVLQTKSREKRGLLSLMKNNLLIKAQMLDFLKGFYISKISLSRFRSLSIISGAFGIFRKDVLLEVGGYRSTIGEDIDITLRIHRYISKFKEKSVVFIPESVCFTELPETWKDFFKQRIRWQKAFIDCLIHFRSFFAKSLFTNPVSFFFLIESFLVGTVSTYVITGLIVTDIAAGGISTFDHYFMFYALYILFAIIYNLTAVKLSSYYGVSINKKDRKSLILTMLFDMFVFRFALLYPVMKGSISYFFNKDWNKVERTGRNYTEKEVSSQAALFRSRDIRKSS